MSGRRRHRLPVAGLLAITVTALAATPPARAAGPVAVTAPIDLSTFLPAKLRVRVRSRMPAPSAHRRARVIRFEIPTKEGYDLVVLGQQGIVAVGVVRDRGSTAAERTMRIGAAATVYVTRGTVTRNRLQASFGRFGRIAVRFRPSGRVVRSHPRRHCKGPDRFTIRPGVFVGNIRFTGEDNYVQVRAHRAKGRIRRPLALRCAAGSIRLTAGSRTRRARRLDDSETFAFGALQAGWREALASTELLALRFGEKVLYLVSSEESLGSMAEVRFGAAIGSSRTFAVDEALTSARLTPPWPFRGTGLYAASADGTRTWTGGLRAAFPGASRFPLAGPRFRVRLESSF